MSLPKAFVNAKEYFKESLQFFNEYNYLLNVPNVEILLHDVLDKIEITNEDFNIFEENIDLSSVNDQFLSQFFVKLKRLQVFYDAVCQDVQEYNYDVPVGLKKKHEIIYLAREIKEICSDIGCDLVVDFGSGLGYLDQMIFETTNYKVLGIECNDSHYVGAKKRQRKYHQNSIEDVKYIKHTVQGDSHERIQVFLKEKFVNNRRVCITGLHACADLTVDAIDIFLKLEEAGAIVIMPCCYHKMQSNHGNFKNFPLSKCLKDIFEFNNGKENLRVPFLRLAAQPLNVDEKLQDLVFNLLSRAVLQLYANKHNCKLKRNRRKPVKTKTMDNNFDTYVKDAATDGFTLISNEPSDDSNRDVNHTFDIGELKLIWKENVASKFKQAAMYVLLQNYLQPVAENFVLYDRLVYLKENGVNNCSFKKILNEKTSPRCLALVAQKDEL